MIVLVEILGALTCCSLFVNVVVENLVSLLEVPEDGAARMDRVVVKVTSAFHYCHSDLGIKAVNIPEAGNHGPAQRAWDFYPLVDGVGDAIADFLCR